MIVKNFIWDSQNKSVSWIYNRKIIKGRYENAYFATVNTQKKFVYVEAGQNFHQNQVYYLSFDGKRIFKLDKLSGKVSWLYKDKIVEIVCKSIINAQLYIEEEVIIVITSLPQSNRTLQCFALNGILLFEKEPPQGYIFVNLSIYKNKPSIICDGGKTNADAYRRSNWHFSIDIKTGDMTKENLAY